VRREDEGSLSLRWAPRELWQQVAHVDPVHANPSVSEYTRRQARRLSHKRQDNQAYFDR